jgi:hypothetical protein
VDDRSRNSYHYHRNFFHQTGRVAGEFVVRSTVCNIFLVLVPRHASFDQRKCGYYRNTVPNWCFSGDPERPGCLGWFVTGTWNYQASPRGDVNTFCAGLGIFPSALDSGWVDLRLGFFPMSTRGNFSPRLAYAEYLGDYEVSRIQSSFIHRRSISGVVAWHRYSAEVGVNHIFGCVGNFRVVSDSGEGV